MTEITNINDLLEAAWSMRREERYEAARDLVNEALRLCKGEDYDVLGRIFHIYMQFESDHDDPSKALDLCRKSLLYYKKGGNPHKIAHSTRHMADLETTLGEEESAERHYREAIRIYRDAPDSSKGQLANALRGFAILLEKRGKIGEAIATWKETRTLYAALNLEAGVEEATSKIRALT